MTSTRTHTTGKIESWFSSVENPVVNGVARECNCDLCVIKIVDVNLLALLLSLHHWSPIPFSQLGHNLKRVHDVFRIHHSLN